MIESFLIPLIAVGLAELGDKTQLCILLLSSKTDKHLRLLLGVVLAFFVVDGVAVLAGSWVTKVAPEAALKVFSGFVFILFGLLILRNNEGRECDTKPLKNPLIAGFSLIFMTEWGDKTQIAAALFATKYRAELVLAGVVVALALLSIAAIYLGRFISTRLDRCALSRISGIIFILMGLSFFLL
ncbi:MAG: TMEM165/GDT1 family protein [Candidatus Altiarchaeota archaeon]|nr:TMEM165/GDT1 family protein [Candidatus Altiarchaeota archaeon]